MDVVLITNYRQAHIFAKLRYTPHRHTTMQVWRNTCTMGNKTSCVSHAVLGHSMWTQHTKMSTPGPSDFNETWYINYTYHTISYITTPNFSPMIMSYGFLVTSPWKFTKTKKFQYFCHDQIKTVSPYFLWYDLSGDVLKGGGHLLKGQRSLS